MPAIPRALSDAPVANRWNERLLASRKLLLRAATVFCGVFLAATSSPAQTSPSTLPDVQFTMSGLVLSIAAQDDGKVLIGGYFSLVNGVARNNIARLNANGSVDETWDAGANQAVRNIVVNGTEVFVLGDFTVIGGLNRNGIAKLSTTDNGAADPIWNPDPPGNLHALALSGTSLFVGGLSYLARLSTTGTGAGEAPWGPQPDYNINALAVHGDNLYVAGNFTSLGQFNRSRLAKVSTLGAGAVDPTWDPQATGGNLGSIPALAVTDRFLYVGGSFDQIGGMSRKNVARLSLDGTGQVDPVWKPDTDHEMVYALAIDDQAVYAGGSFSQIGGLPRHGLAKLNSAGAGAADPQWGAGGTDRRWVTALAVIGNSVFVGGDFTAINGVVSLSVAKLNPASGACDDSFLAQVGYPGRTLALARQDDGKVIVGGNFSLAGGLPRQNLARFNVDGTLDSTWLPNADGPVTAITIQGTDIFVAGQFETIGGQARRFLAKLSATEAGADATWNPALSEPVEALGIEATNLFVASSLFGSGSITKLSTSGAGRRDLNWNPGRFERFGGNPLNPVVKSLVASAASLYVAGDFDSIGRDTELVARSGLVKLSATGTGAPDLQWDPPYRYGVNALALDDTNLYVAGLFGLARVNVAGTGAADSNWHPDVAAGYVDVLALSGTNLYAGGSLTTPSGLTNATLVRLSTSGSGLVDPNWNPNPRGLNYAPRNVVGLVANGTDVYVIGEFDNIGGTTRHGFAFLPVADAPLLTKGASATIFAHRNPLDGPEVTHFRITTIDGGNLFLPGRPEPVTANSFITVQQGETGLRFVADGTTPSAVAAVSALNPTADGAGRAETILTFTDPSIASSLQLKLGEGLILVGNPGHTYQIEYTDSLHPSPVWLPLNTVTLQADSQIIPIETEDTLQRFFRARTQR